MSPRGRPRSFDRTDALDRAVLLFWEHGYDAVSVSALTEAMGINPPSLYAAFGSKEQLFAEAVQRYEELEGGAAARALRSPSAREAIEALLRSNATAYTDPNTPRGCLVVLAAGNGTARHDGLDEVVATSRRTTLRSLDERLRRGVEEGELPPTLDTGAVAGFVVAVMDGLSLRAREGATEADLQAIVDVALAGWPALTA